MVLFMLLCPLTLRADAVGTWRIYPSFSNIEDIEIAGKYIFVKASSNLYSYNTTDGSLQTYDKTNFLSDINLQNVSWNSTVKRLLLTYENFNIDVMTADGEVVNIPDLLLKVMAGSKKINSVTQEGQYAYLACDFGILKIDMKNAYVADSYILDISIKNVVIVGDYIYALRSEGGLLRASLTANLNDPASWTQFSKVYFQYLFSFNGHLVGMTDGNANTIDTTTGEVTQFATFAFSWAKKFGDRILCGKAKNVNEILPDLTTKKYTYSANLNVVGYDKTSDSYWSNNTDGLLTRFSISGTSLKAETTGVMPDGPATNACYRLAIDGDNIYAINGYTNVDGSSGLNGEIYYWNGSKWNRFQNNIGSVTGRRYRNLACIKVNPFNKDIVMVGGETGLYKFDKGSYVQVYDPSNSPLTSGVPTSSNPNNWAMVLSMTYDKTGNLWVADSYGTSIVCLKQNGEWDVFDHTDLLEGLMNINSEGSLIDKRGYYWFCSTRWESSRVFCYDIKNDKLIRFDDFVNQDDTKYEAYLKNLAEDNKGNIWIASNRGPFYMTPENLLTGNYIMTQHKVPRNDGTNYADYLLADVDILCITVDAANRKWMGTNGQGVFVISDDCNVQEYHFTTENSPLSSDVVTDIQIDEETGKVYFATNKGICSYMSGVSKSNTDVNVDNVWAYPNPVTPEYDGMITVRGLENGSQVTVTTVSGQKVASGNSVGGSFLWDGTDLNGERVASGVYMVLVATPDGKSGIATKIAVVR